MEYDYDRWGGYTYCRFSYEVRNEEIFIDYEDGVFVHEKLMGRYVTVIGDQGSFAGSVVRKIGDPYGEKFMELREEE